MKNLIKTAAVSAFALMFFVSSYSYGYGSNRSNVRSYGYQPTTYGYSHVVAHYGY